MTEKTVLVVSPFGGIGKAVTPYLIQEGWNVIGIGGARSKAGLQELSQEGRFEFHEIDYQGHENMESVMTDLKDKHERIEGFVHLTGGSLISKEAGEIPTEDFKKVLELNLSSAFVLAQEAFSWMKSTGGGNLIFFGSTTGIVPSKKKLPYAVAKAGVHMLARALALEGAPFGIRSNVIAPGYVMTERHIAELRKKAEQKGIAYEQMLDEIRAKNPMKGLLWPEDLNQVVTLLLTTKTITGEIISTDLGQTTIL